MFDEVSNTDPPDVSLPSILYYVFIRHTLTHTVLHSTYAPI
jgi:hypothetical protein